MQNNPVAQINPQKMVDGETQIVQVNDHAFFGVKKIKNVVHGKILDFKTVIGKSREEVEQQLK